MSAAQRSRPGLLLLVLVLAGLCGFGHQAAAQLGVLSSVGSGPAPSGDKPVTFTADQVQYDQDRALVIATGHVEAWQNDRVLRADRIVFDRNTNVAAASGNVVLLEPDGSVVFSDYAELSEGMRNGIMKGMRALLAQNARLAANGARRTEGKVNEMSRMIYSTCNLCAKDPSKPPLWDIRALTAVQDLEHKKIEYEDAVLDMFGIPIAYFPYMWHVDPSVKRASGLLIPAIGYSKNLGAFAVQPYYWVIDDQQDATITPWITSKQGSQLELDYRLRLNEGSLTVQSSAADSNGGFGGHVFSSGRFNYDDTWRYGFDFNRASSAAYLHDFSVAWYADVLTSQFFLEGFGQGSYTRFDSRFYQSLITGIANTNLPVVAPRYTYSYFGQPDDLGGRLSFDVGGFNVLRSIGTNTQRASLSANWERPFSGQLGDLWKFTFHVDAASYSASQLNEIPNFSPISSNSLARAQPQAAVEVRWPFWRDGGASGTQLIEPIAQVIVAPNIGNSQLVRVPNEDSVAFEFSDANLFSFNRFPGIDRLEGGVRANVGLHGDWTLGGVNVDGLVGQSYRTESTQIMPPLSGLNGNVSDIVGRVSVHPTNWLDVTYRTRLGNQDLAVHSADALASIGQSLFTVTGGYLYTNTNPFYLYDQAGPPPASYFLPRNEITLGASTKFGHWRFSTSVRRNLQTNQMVSLDARGTYEDECFIFDADFNRRYTSIDFDHGETIFLLQVTFKTVGTFGVNAL